MDGTAAPALPAARLQQQELLESHHNVKEAGGDLEFHLAGFAQAAKLAIQFTPPLLAKPFVQFVSAA